MVFVLVQSNKREKENSPSESQNNKELEQPVASEPPEKPKLSSSQPQPPSPPGHGQARRTGGKAERGVKRSLKNKAAMDSVAERGAVESTIKSNQMAEQQQQELGVKRSGVRATNTTALADRQSTAANENATPPAEPPTGRVPCREEDNRSETRQEEHKEKHRAVAAAPAAASHNNKTQVSLQI